MPMAKWGSDDHSPFVLSLIGNWQLEIGNSIIDHYPNLGGTPCYLSNASAFCGWELASCRTDVEALTRI